MHSGTYMYMYMYPGMCMTHFSVLCVPQICWWRGHCLL